MDNSIRVRIAPSPTGKLHIGTARTALFNYLFARRYGGKFVVRIEDTDVERSKDEYSRDILDGLLWLGMEWDEGPELGGPFAPYNQKDRLKLYQPYIDRLLENKKAYRCYCTQEELTREREAQQKSGKAPIYSGKCRHLTDEQIAAHTKAGKKFAIRFATEVETIEFDDLIRGHVSFEAALFGDFTIVRSDGMPLFLVSNVIDDQLMEITHVLRGEDHLANTAKQIMLARALEFMNPQFGHFPLILNPNRSKMSKRKDPVSITDDFKARGFLPEALVNFIALLGWSSGDDREIYTMHELTEQFQIERVGKSPSIFDQEKLLWMNGYYLRHLDIGDLASRAQNFITDKELFKKTLERPDYYMQTVSLIQDRLKLLSEVEEQIAYFYTEPEYEAALLVPKKSDRAQVRAGLEGAVTALEKQSVFVLDELELTLRHVAESQKLKAGEVLWPLRVALSGQPASPGVFELLEVIGKEESLKRIKKAIEKLH